MYYTKHVFICTNQKPEGKTCCANTGGKSFFDFAKQKLNTLGLHGEGKIRLSQSGCLGRCGLGPCLVIYPEGTWYFYHTESDIDDIIKTHLIEGKILDRLHIL